MGAFGEKFRKAREAKELSFDDVSKVIKIAPRMLQAIEQENFDQLPGGVFNKGFIRSYAKQLGLNPEDAVAEYLENIRQSQIEAQQAWQPPRPAEKTAVAPAKNTKAKEATSTGSSKTPVEVEELPELHLPRAEDVRPARKTFIDKSSPEIPWRLVGAAAVVVVLGFILWTRHSHTFTKDSSPVAKAATSTATGSNASAPAQATSVNPAAQPAGTPAAPQPTAGANAPSTPAAETEDKNDVTVRTFGAKPVAKSSDKPVGALSLVIRATENSWISVVADGQAVTEETLIAPASTTFHASNEFVVKVGNAAAVSFLINGKEVEPQGNEAEVKTLTFDSTGLKAQ
jgi:cytoskeleton protein RodZ